ncbi:MAG: OPT/YSL family transporter [Candidatus Obscuribacter sp.]|nr:OPT/YSL family transporter [Candidatus Obscuribacter sp.]
MLGVFLAVPMKRQMINKEKLPFPSGIAAAQTLKSLHGKSKEAVVQAYALVAAMVAAGLTGFLKNGQYPWQIAAKLKIPEFIEFNLPWQKSISKTSRALALSPACYWQQPACLSVCVYRYRC